MEETKAIALLKSGDIGGLKMLVELYQAEAVQAACLIIGDRLAAEDIVQTAFLRSFEKIKTFDEARPFRPWFLRIVVNDALKAANRLKGRVSLADDEEDAGYQAVIQHLGAATREPEETAQRRELVEEMQNAISRLSPAQRTAVVMRYFLGLSTEEIAGQMQNTPTTIRWHLSMAREKLRRLLVAFK